MAKLGMTNQMFYGFDPTVQGLSFEQLQDADQVAIVVSAKIWRSTLKMTWRPTIEVSIVVTEQVQRQLRWRRSI